MGTLSIDAGATVTSTNPTASAITLRGADINIDTSANPAVVGASRQLEHHAHRHPHRAERSRRPGLRLQRQPLRGQLGGNDTVSEFAPGSTTPTATLTGLNDPDALAFDSSGNLYVANWRRHGTVSEFAPGSTTPTATLTGLN